MQVSTSAYYAWTKQPETTEKTKDNGQLETKIRQIFDDFKQTYGSRRLVGELHKGISNNYLRRQHFLGTQG